MMILAMHEYPDWVEAEEGGQMYEEESQEYEEEEEEEEDEEDYPEGEEESDEEDSEGLGEEESDEEDPVGPGEEESDQEVPDVGEEEYDEEDPEEHQEFEEEVWEEYEEEDGEVYEDDEENWYSEEEYAEEEGQEEANEQEEEGRADEEEGGDPPEDDHNGDSEDEEALEEEKDEDEGELEEEYAVEGELEGMKKEYYEEGGQDLEEEKEDEADGPAERYCAYCNLSFASDGALVDHLRNSSRHNWCPECDHDFDTAGRLRNHEVCHLPKVHPCLRHGCAGKFAAMSALAKHMEKSRCFGRPSAATLVEKVRDWETKSGNPNLLTKPRIGWHDSYMYTISRSSTYYANEGAWNGRAYDCYYCDKECNTLYSLNQHVHSGIHDSEPKDFCCKQCGFTATWMSGLIEHIESEKCGYMSRDEVHSFARKPLKFALLTLGCP